MVEPAGRVGAVIYSLTVSERSSRIKVTGVIVGNFKVVVGVARIRLLLEFISPLRYFYPSFSSNTLKGEFTCTGMTSRRMALYSVSTSLVFVHSATVDVD